MKLRLSSRSAFQRFSVSAFQRFSVSAFACLALSGCQVVNDTLGAVNSTLSSVNSVLSDTSSALSGSTVSSSTKSSATSALNKAKPNTDAKKLFNDARPTIESMIALAACEKSSERMARYNAPDIAGIFVSPLNSVMYHQSGCMNVLRINNIQKKASNTVSFKVYYISPQSEETIARDYTAIKQPDGEWLFRWW